MTESIRLRVATPSLKLKSALVLPASLDGDNFIDVSQVGGNYTVKADYALLDQGVISDTTQTIIAVYDEVSQSYKGVSIASIYIGPSLVDQHVTEAGPVTVLTNASTVRIDQTVGAAVTLNLPAAASMVAPDFTIADWKGDAGTNNITIVPNGTEKIQGRSSWTLAADNASIQLRPVGGVGFVI